MLIEELITLIIALVVTIGMLAFIIFIFSPIESPAMVSKTLALEASNAMSGMINAPLNTTKVVTLPAMNCSIAFVHGSVNATSSNYSYISSYVISEKPVGIKVESAIMCNPATKTQVYFRKVNGLEGFAGGVIEISLDKGS